MRSPRTPLLLTVVLAACGDSGSPVGTPPAAFQRLSLTSVDGSMAAAEPRSVARFGAPEDIEAWSVDAPRSAIERDDDGSAVLFIGGKGLKRVTVPGPIPDASQLIVLLRNGAHGTLRASFLRDGVEAIVVQGEVLKGRQLHPVSIELPADRPRDVVYDAVVLEFDVRGQSRIRSVDMVERPLASFLPSVESGPELVLVGTESRRAVALEVGRPLVARFDSRGAGRLVIAAAMPMQLPRVPTGQVVVAQVRTSVDGGEPETEVFMLLLEPTETWLSLSLDDSLEGAFEVELELLSEVPGDVCILAEPALYPVISEPQTVLVVTSDTHRADHLGLTASGTELDTPNLDAFAARGVLFEDAWATSNTTIPSHAALLSGLHPRDTKLLGNYSSLAQEATTLAETFAARGYRTIAVISSTHLGHEFSGLGQGFDLALRPSGSEADARSSIERLIGELNSCEGTPVFAWLHLFDAHAPYLPPLDFDRRYYPRDRDPFDTTLPEIDLEGGRLPLWLNGLRDPEFPRAQYRAEIASLDAALAPLLAHDRVTRGITAITSDHGEVFARRGVFYEHKGLLPDTLHVPLMLAWPGATGGERVARPVRQMDVGRTLLDLAGLGVPGGLGAAEFPGRNLVRDGGGGDEPRFAVSRRFASVTQGKWHCAITLTDLAQSKDGVWPRRHQVELFDIEADPGCLVDLAAAEPETTRRLRGAIASWLANADPVLQASKPNLDRAARINLAALGYADDGAGADTMLLDPDCECAECARHR